MAKNDEKTEGTRKGETETKQIIIDSDWVIGFFGSRGTGKSTLMLINMQPLKRIVVYDPIYMNHYKYFESFDYRSFGNMKKRIEEARDDNKKMYVRYVAWDDTDEEFERVSNLVWQTGFPVVFVVEELASHIHGGNLTPNFYKLMRMGRNRAIGIWFSTQHPKMVPPKVRNNIDAIWVFAIHEPDSRDYMKKWIGEQYEPTRLKKYGFYYWQSGERGLLPCKPLTLSKKLKQLTTKKLVGQHDLENM